MAQIERRAYEIWLSEGCPLWRDRIQWARAEAEFREKLAIQYLHVVQVFMRSPRPNRFERVLRATAIARRALN